MTNVQNNITSSSTNNAAALEPSQFTSLNAKNLMAKVKQTIKAMNLAEARSRKAMAEMVASFVEMGEAYINDTAITSAIDAECKAHGVDPVNLDDPKWKDKNPNIFLPLVSIVDGKWVPDIDLKSGTVKKDKDGNEKKKWSRNRSFEKYAGIIRFFIHNGFSHKKVVDILTGDVSMTVEGLDYPVQPLIRDIVKADTEQQNGKRRAPQVWTTDAKVAAKQIKPVAVIEFNDVLQNALTLSEGYAAVIVRVGDAGLEVLGDTGLTADALYRVIKNRTPDLLAREKQVDRTEVSDA